MDVTVEIIEGFLHLGKQVNTHVQEGKFLHTLEEC